MPIKKMTELALLATIALTIFIIEAGIPNPIPIPGVKLGLANIVTVYAIYHYRPSEVFLLVIMRIILGAIFGGNIMALLYSLAGGMLCLVGMLLLCQVISVSHLWICSILGAVFHNTGQLLMAILITGTIGVVAYFPLLLVSGCSAGMFTGLCAQFLIKHHNKLRKSSIDTGKRFHSIQR